MARATLPLLALMLLPLSLAAMAKPTGPTNFIVASCRATVYLSVCVQSLSKHAKAIGKNQHQLAQITLTKSLTQVESTKANMLRLTKTMALKPMEYGALKDCLDHVEESMDRLSQSVRELEQLGQAQGEDFSWHKINVETLTSSAQIEMGICLRTRFRLKPLRLGN